MDAQKNITTLKKITPLLLVWYDQRARKLPWRENPTPYRVWVSEIILQQTRVEAGKKYFERFIRQLPDVKSLADADEKRLLKLWEGLGYYNRARNLQKAAKIIVEKHEGALPASCEQLKQLPGIGEYTAGAISSIAFGLRQPAIDANVLRVLSRLMCLNDDIAKESTKKLAAHCLQKILPNRAGDFNQALMELGALICRPNGVPLCDECPIKKMCKAYADKRQADFPVKQSKQPRKIQRRTVFLLVCKGKIAVNRRPEDGLLAGLWEFPSADGNLSREEACNWLAQRQMTPIKMTAGLGSQYVFSHLKWELSSWNVCLSSVPYQTVDAMQLSNEIPIASAFAPYVKKALTLLECHAT